MDSTLEKSFKIFFDFLCAISCVLIIPLFFSPVSETLVLVSKERLFFYAFIYGISFLFFGEVLGLRETNFHFGLGKSLLLPLMSASLGVLTLLLLVWAVEYSFIGRFAVVKILSWTALGSLISSFLIKKFFTENPTRSLLLLSVEQRKAIIEGTKQKSYSFNWIDLGYQQDEKETNVEEICKENDIDLLVIDDEITKEDFDIVRILGNGTQVIGLLDFWQKYIGCIPPSEVNQSWLSKLDLRIRNPLALKLKRCADVIFSTFALIFLSPLLIFVFLLVAIDSGFPLVFSQTRTGYLNKNFTVYKIRTMRKDAENNGAVWAKENDSRITRLGNILRKLRIDEIPQFWNVIKGDMSIVGPRPERPEFQEELLKSVPHWNTRHLVKPGITGWAQIKYMYASNMDASEQKLAYDLYYLRNLSFALDFEIILATLRSIGKGSR